MITMRLTDLYIVALRNEKGSYSKLLASFLSQFIVALRNEKGSYSSFSCEGCSALIVALRNEKGSYSMQQVKEEF